MVEVEVIGVFVEKRWKDRFTALLPRSLPRWYALVALEMVDKTKGSHQNIAEWFYLLVCSPSYRDNPKKNGPVIDTKYTLVSKDLDLDKVLKEARARVNNINADNWDGFYQEMNKYFLADD